MASLIGKWHIKDIRHYQMSLAWQISTFHRTAKLIPFQIHRSFPVLEIKVQES